MNANVLTRRTFLACTGLATGISVSLARPFIYGEPDTNTTVTPDCAIGREHHF
jgi:hypothetical protein